MRSLVLVLVALASGANGFAPSCPLRYVGSPCVRPHRSGGRPPLRASPAMDAGQGTKAAPWSKAATFLAAAAVLSASTAVDAIPLGGLSGYGDPSSHAVQGPPSAMGVLLVADEEGLEGLGAGSTSGPVDIAGLVRELGASDNAEKTLATMIKINELADNDVDGLLDDPIAKETLVSGLVDKRKSGSPWSDDTQFAYDFLKRKLDPYNVVLLRPYLKVAPYLGGVYYLAAFAVQQKLRPFFPAAYFAAVGALVAPAVFTLVTN